MLLTLVIALLKLLLDSPEKFKVSCALELLNVMLPLVLDPAFNVTLLLKPFLITPLSKKIAIPLVGLIVPLLVTLAAPWTCMPADPEPVVVIVPLFVIELIAELELVPDFK